jgi:hypothetical protein
MMKSTKTIFSVVVVAVYPTLQLTLFHPVHGFSITPTRYATTLKTANFVVPNSRYHGDAAVIPTTMSPSSRTTTTFLQAGLFGGTFGGGGGSTDEKKDAILGSYEIVSPDADDTTTIVLFESLSDYICNEWAQLFVNGNIKLTTPVKLETFVSPQSSSSDDVETASGVRLIFQKRDSGYKSKREEEEEEDQSGQKAKKKQNEEPRQGGVEIMVEKLRGQGRPFRITAKRCEVDDDTTIKEMSEETIVHELQTAIDVWKKDMKLKK